MTFKGLLKAFHQKGLFHCIHRHVIVSSFICCNRGSATAEDYCKVYRCKGKAELSTTGILQCAHCRKGKAYFGDAGARAEVDADASGPDTS